MAHKPPFVRRPPPSAAESTPVEEPVAEAPAPPAPPRARGRREVDPNAPDTLRPTSVGDVPMSAGLAALDAIAHGALDMGALLGAATPGRNRLEPGQAVRGTVVRVANDGVHIDLGARAEGWIALRDAPSLKVGDTVQAYVVATDEQGVQLSTRLSGESAAAHLAEALEQGIPVEAKVESRSSGGYSVKVGPVRAFMPMGQAARLPLAQPDALIGQTIEVKVLEVGEKVVVSRRALEEARIGEARKARLAALQPGAVVEATITSVQTWAAFLDIDGVELMLPRREASWEDVSDLTTRFERGQPLLVRVLGQGDGERILVSVKDPGLDPWVARLDKVQPGATFRGKVVSATDFGVFVEVLPGLQGLVHRSRLQKVPTPGDGLDVVVRSVDPDRRRLELAATDPAIARADKGPREASPEDEDERAWRQSYAQQGKSSGGTLGDLFGKLKA